MLRAPSLSIFVFVAALSTSSTTYAQATIRPIPRVARSWEAAAMPANPNNDSGKIIPAVATSDLGFVAPAPANRMPAEEPLAESSAVGSAEEIVELRLFAGGIGSSNFQGNQGSLTTQRGGWDVSLGERSPRGLSYAIEIGTEASFYDYSGSPVAGATDPFNDVYDTRLAGRFLFAGEGRREFYGGLQLGNAGEDAVGIDDSLYLGGALAMRYNAAPNFALLVGIAGMSRFDDSPWVLPYIGFDWQVSERLRLATEAAEIHADYELHEDWSVGLAAIYDFRQFRLNKTGPLNGGSFRDEEIRAGAELTWRIADDVELSFSAGKILWREVTFHDGQAGFLGETELSSPIYAGLELKVGF